MIAERAAAVLFSEGEFDLSAYRLPCKAICRSIYYLLPFKRPSEKSVHYIKTVHCIRGNTMESTQYTNLPYWNEKYPEMRIWRAAKFINKRLTRIKYKNEYYSR